MKYSVKINKEKGTIALQVEVLPLIPRENATWNNPGTLVDPDRNIIKFNARAAAAYLKESGFDVGKVLEGTVIKNVSTDTNKGAFVFELQQKVKTTPRKKLTSKVKSKK
jgi:hypothetical protein